MGIFSGWFSSSSSTSPSSPPAGTMAAGNIARNGPPAAAGQHGSKNVWRNVFDPGSNPNIDRVGSGYYDTVKDPKTAPTTWDMILKAQDFRRRSFSELDRDNDGFVDAKELKAVLPPSMAAVDTSALIEQAKPQTTGKLTRREFNEVLNKYFLA